MDNDDQVLVPDPVLVDLDAGDQFLVPVNPERPPCETLGVGTTVLQPVDLADT